MSKEFTSLSIPKTLAKEIRGFDGRNNEERLKAWAEQFEAESTGVTWDEVEDLIERKIAEASRR